MPERLATNHLQKLLDYCDTSQQQKIVQAVIEHGGVRAAARALGMANSGLSRMITRLEQRAARQGYSPEHAMTREVPDGYYVRGVSSYYDKDGKLAAQWVKSNVDQERQQALFREAVDAVSEALPRLSPTPAPKLCNDALANLYVLTDYHLGMQAWHEEAGEDWDLKIAEQMLYSWIKRATEQAPKAHTAIFAQLGDFLHWDGLEAVTPTSGHVLDADTRFQKVVRVAIRTMRRTIEELRKKYQHVIVVVADANHDPAGCVWLRDWLAAMYENEPRVTVDTSADTYYCVEWGDTSLFFHHGHKRKPSAIDDVFAAKFRAVFGRTKHSYAHMGHMHHVDVKETNLMLVEQHRTLAAKDT